MAERVPNGITYEGRVVVRKDDEIEFGQANGTTILGPIVLAEDHRAKVGRVRKMGSAYAEKIRREEEREGPLADDDYMTYETSWHRLTIFGDKAEELAQDERFGPGALVIVRSASYTEEAPWETRDGVKRAGRPETIGNLGDGSVEIKFDQREPSAIWDGISEIPARKQRGGGGAQREYSENEGF